MSPKELSLLDDMLADDSDTLGDFEIHFIESLSRNLDVPLSEKQAAVFTRIAWKLGLEQ